jgi:hypothetical protein
VIKYRLGVCLPPAGSVLIRAALALRQAFARDDPYAVVAAYFAAIADKTPPPPCLNAVMPQICVDFTAKRSARRVANAWRLLRALAPKGGRQEGLRRTLWRSEVEMAVADVGDFLEFEVTAERKAAANWAAILRAITHSWRQVGLLVERSFHGLVHFVQQQLKKVPPAKPRFPLWWIHGLVCFGCVLVKIAKQVQINCVLLKYQIIFDGTNRST